MDVSDCSLICMIDKHISLKKIPSLKNLNGIKKIKSCKNL